MLDLADADDVWFAEDVVAVGDSLKPQCDN